ncbi:MAG TPA: alpha/beta fold hydrolase [Desulfobacterales bacterium]
MPTVTVNQDRIFYTISSGRSPCTLLCIHGSGGDHRHWPERLRNLTKFRVAALDLPGHGRSRGFGCNRVTDYADVVEKFVMGLGLTAVVPAGHSLGGAIVQSLALRRPSWLKAIVLVGTGARLRVTPEILDALQSDYESAVVRICHWSYGPSATPELIREGRDGLLDTPREVTFGDYAACNDFDIMAQVHRIKSPALVLSGSADRLTPPKYGEYLTRKIPGATHRIMEDCGHMMAVEKPESFVSLVTEFLDALQ